MIECKILYKSVYNLYCQLNSNLEEAIVFINNLPYITNCGLVK